MSRPMQREDEWGPEVVPGSKHDELSAGGAQGDRQDKMRRSQSSDSLCKREPTAQYQKVIPMGATILYVINLLSIFFACSSYWSRVCMYVYAFATGVEGDFGVPFPKQQQ